MKTMKLGITYSLFDGEELLPFSILAIRPHVDYINVVWQEHSWFGDKCTPLVRPLLADLKNKHLIDEAIEYKFHDFGNGPRLPWYVLEKKTLGVEDLKRAGCTHCMIMDCDEFYFADQFAKAKQFVAEKGITHSACSYYNYRYMPDIRERDCSPYAIPFILELRSDSHLTPQAYLDYPAYSDMLRLLDYTPNKDKFYYFSSIYMHHMTGIRFNFSKKAHASYENVTSYGKAAMDTLEKNYNTAADMTKAELLSVKNEFGGYIDVGDPFNLKASLENLRRQVEMFIPPPFVKSITSMAD